MNTIYPSFYKDFSCIASDCSHSCCKGWEIDIDNATAEKYLKIEGSLGDELRANISSANGVYSFGLAKNGACPFLQEDGLCKLILSAGEEILCEICTNHPRFYTVLNDYELAGVGLSCEVSCGLLLRAGSLEFSIEGQSDNLSFSELLKLLGINMKKEQQTFHPGLSKDDALEVLEIMGNTEPIDDKWREDIAAYMQYAQENPEFLENYERIMPHQAFQRIYQYIMYRQLEKISDYSLDDLLIYTDISTEYIFIAAAITGDLPEAIRRWSEQIEYCPENVAMLLKM